jgi:hypothetical protein
VRHIATFVTSFSAREYEISHPLHLHTDANGYLTMPIKYCTTCNSYYLREMGKDCRRDLRDLLHNYNSPDLRKNSRISRKSNQVIGLKLESYHVNCFPLAVMFKSVATKAARSKAWVCGRSLTKTAGSNPAGDMVICLLRVLCVCHRQVSLSRPEESYPVGLDPPGLSSHKIVFFFRSENSRSAKRIYHDMKTTTVRSLGTKSCAM